MRIACNRWYSWGRPNGVFQIAHGIAEHIGRYTGLIERLVESGLVVFGNDHRGHGLSALSPRQFGDFGPGGFDLLVENIGKLSRIAGEESPQLPLILLGHSLGSFDGSEESFHSGLKPDRPRPTISLGRVSCEACAGLKGPT
jgi:alpha-beta hydrolase superfamily lysophospholipase